MLKKISCLLLFMLSACSSDSGPEQRPPPPPPMEVIPVEVLGLGTHSMELQAREELSDLGVRHVRHTLYVPLYLTHPTYPISFGAQLKEMIDAGFEMLLVVHPLPDDMTPEQLGSLVAGVARDFPEIDAFQIGNEDIFRGDVEQHILFHNAAYDSIKSVNDIEVISMAWTQESDAEQFAEAAHFDAIAIHTYGFPVSQSIKNWAGITSQYEVWITEFGFQPPQLPSGWTGDWEEEQAEQWKGAVLEAGRAEIERMYGYQLRTQEDRELHGLIRDEDGSYRPAAEWLKSEMERRNETDSTY